MSGMREISLQGRTNKTTREMVEAIAWATNRRGRNPWKSSDNASVVTVIQEYLHEHNVSLIGGTDKQSARTKYALNRLVAEGYAYSKFKGEDASKRMVEFGFHPDVNLTGYTPKFKAVPLIADVGADIGPITPTPVDADRKYQVLINPNPPPIVPLPPIIIPRYKEDEIEALLDKWAQKDSEAYADWADKLIATLKVIVNG
jgi:hypothetical protein